MGQRVCLDGKATWDLRWSPGRHSPRWLRFPGILEAQPSPVGCSVGALEALGPLVSLHTWHVPCPEPMRVFVSPWLQVGAAFANGPSNPRKGPWMSTGYLAGTYGQAVNQGSTIVNHQEVLLLLTIINHPTLLLLGIIN